MAVFDPRWWVVWWPWLLVWAAAAGLLVAVVVIVVRHSQHERQTAGRRPPGTTLYLDGDEVMNLYFQQEYKAAFRKEVQERITSSRDGELKATIPMFQARGSEGVNREVFRSYIDEAAPITVVSIVIKVLDKAHDIIDVDLAATEVSSRRAVHQSLGGGSGQRVRLQGRQVYVSIYGLFRVTDLSATETVIEAPFGAADSTERPRIHISCKDSSLSDEISLDRSFPARCLGRVQVWDTAAARLIVRPIAIFH